MGWEDRAYHREDRNGGIPPVQFRFPPITRLSGTLIVLNLVIFIVQASWDRYLMTYWGGLTFFEGWAFTQPWRWITYQYLHSSASHVFFNMLALFFFLPALEQVWGWRKALGFYTLGGIAAGIAFGLLCLATGGRAPLIGASGSVFAAMGAVALLMPERQLILLVFPVPIRMAVALFAAFFLLASLADRDFSSAAHLGGLAFGFFAPWLIAPKVSGLLDRVGFATPDPSSAPRGPGIRARRKMEREAEAEAEEQKRVDEILAKVSSSGMNSLSRSERSFLKKATENQRKRDAAKVAARKRGL
ncbi:rhomboid family protein [Humisphaera borealis]|uniref:Rhomboid family intramembrane serine protease n=1 Tax=Humisphaera borealis TaxID=2807512 RepID=A0A7M2WVT3_9BACT|nr:rhomboid family intramembrane serine protease [Humisphaera borealis]QOV89533.1 rhomboid family intramembrane serine protease [Humisphaera borealis]